MRRSAGNAVCIGTIPALRPCCWITWTAGFFPAIVALQAGHIVGYAFCVCEGAKAVIGDVYAFGETESTINPICDTLLHHLLELVQATPGVDRVESQLLMFPDGALGETFRASRVCQLPALLHAARSRSASLGHGCGSRHRCIRAGA